MARLAGKIAIITGGARGMGAAHAELFIKEGAKVVITDILEEEGKKTEAKLGKDCLFIKHDVTKREDWEAVVEKTKKHFGNPTVLINNAGIAVQRPWHMSTDEEYHKTYMINQFGVYLGMITVFPAMKEAGVGSIVNISSTAGMEGYAGLFSYVASKFAVRGMTKSAALEFGADNVRVNSVHPGVIRTPMTMENPDVDKSMVEAIGDTVALKRIADPIEVSNLCLYLASDESSYSTGSEFIVDGGKLAG